MKKSFIKGLLRGFFFCFLLCFFLGGVLFFKPIRGNHGPNADVSYQQLPETADSEETAEPPEEPEPEPEPVPETKTTISLAFVGDILFNDATLAAYGKSGVSSFLSSDLLDKMTAADYLFANQEFPFSTRGTQAPDKQFTFRIDPVHAPILQEFGIDLVTLANNHILDFGTDALLDSIETLDQISMKHVGAGENLSDARAAVREDFSGTSISFLGASRVMPVSSWAAGPSHPGVFSTYDPAQLEKDIAAEKEQSDYVIVYVHWGIERQDYPEAYQRDLAKRYIDAGADAVIGSHPHVMQGFEFYNGKPIAYSLGNFLFSNSSADTALLHLNIAPDSDTLSLSLTPCRRVNGQLQIMEQTADYYSYLSSISYGATVEADGRIVPAG